MNAVEIEEAVAELARQSFDGDDFPFAFLRAFGRRDVELQRLRRANASDVPGGVLRRDSLHMAVCAPGATGAALAILRDSPKTAANRVKFILATDGVDMEAEEVATGEVRAFPLTELDRHFGFFLPLAGISAVRHIKDNPIDVKAVGRLNKLYVELLRENPDWTTEEKRPELNRLMSRLVFCFFAEDTGIFRENLFTATVQQMSDGGVAQTNTDEVLGQLFLAMATPTQHDGKPDGRYRQAAGVKPYADGFPFVNGGLFEDAGAVPRFSRAARNYLLRAGELDWKEINPDIFGSMIQAVADDDERGSLGMHYTSVPNILKVLNPLFLDELREKLTEAEDSVRKLRTLRRRIGRIRVFDPACGSGNFLVIAYRHMREIERDIIKLTGDDPKSVIPLTNFYGIEIKGFAAEIARLALLIAEFQADARLISQQAARSMVLPLHRSGQIRTGNALREDWLEVCPPAATVREECDLGGPTGRLALEENGFSEIEALETYLCGNPPYVGDKVQTPDQKLDLQKLRVGRVDIKAVDYIAGWFWKATDYISQQAGRYAFVSTNSVCQGVQVPLIWPRVLSDGRHIFTARQSFLWGNNAARNAQVTCVVVGVTSESTCKRFLYNEEIKTEVPSINAYLVSGADTIVERANEPISTLPVMYGGNIPRDQGNLLLDTSEADRFRRDFPEISDLIFPIVGSSELINGTLRYCFWISDSQAAIAYAVAPLRERLERVRAYRLSGSERGRAGVDTPYKFERTITGSQNTIVIPSVSSERRRYLPCGLLGPDVRVSNLALALYDAPLWSLALIVSRVHLAWVATICGKMKTDYRYSNTMGWNTFPVPPLTEQDKADLTRCAENILLAREAHFPATIADLYDPETDGPRLPKPARRA